MYQLMIIDDEPIVRAGIRQLLPWSDYNFEICAEGIDGKDGLKKILEHSPDLVLVDVKMPGMSGIELIREAKRQNFEGKFIILTGYSDFEFAKSAISLGVRAYLLKPIDEEELRENIEEVFAELEAKKSLDDYYTQNELRAREVVLRRLIQPVEDEDSLRREIKLYGMDYKYNVFCVAILNHKDEQTGQNAAINSTLIEQMKKGLKNIDSLIVDDNLVFICKGYTYNEAKERILQNNERIKRKFNDSFFISIGHDVFNLEDINFSYECAKLLIDYRFLYNDLESVDIDELKTPILKGNENFASEICQLIDIGDKEGIESSFNDIKTWYKSKIMKETEIKVHVIHNIVLLYGILEKKYFDKIDEFPSFELLIEMIKECNSLEELIYIISNYAIDVTKIIGIATTDNIIIRVLAYMERNYVQDLKLEDIAKTFCYNSAYLGKIFKNTTGESFNDMLNQIRIKNAQKLLRESDLKVYQISEAVGYSNTDYFYSKFRKLVGTTPKKYLEIWQTEQKDKN